MVSKGQGKIVLWPHYFDARLSRSAGRRVPSSLAVSSPDVKWIESAARKAGLDPVAEEGAKHPSIPYKVVGRVVIEARGKEEILRQVAKQMAAGQ